MVVDTECCTGCRTCEMACSYHHKGIFCPSISSIEIIDKPKELGFGITFYMEPDSDHLACNGCQGLEVPFCVKYCPAIARNELKEIISKLITTRSK
jgi:Fe-S-cluster-containing dehydrogenase component